jgi:hypothetical protein
MVGQKRPSTLRGMLPVVYHVFGDGRLTDLDGELEQLTVNPLSTQRGLSCGIWRIRSQISLGSFAVLATSVGSSISNTRENLSCAIERLCPVAPWLTAFDSWSRFGTG